VLSVDWEAANRLTTFVPDEAVETLLAEGSAGDFTEHIRALSALDIDT
jgi:hypothetical protein